MAKQKTKWPCGHTGHGRFCHVCKQLQIEKARVEQLRVNKKAQLKPVRDVVDLSLVPIAHARTARDIIQRVTNGMHWSQCGGRRIHAMKQIIVFELGKHWRLIGTDAGDKPFQFDEVCSHQDYNTILKMH